MIGRRYFVAKRPADFPIDLLRLGTPSVFMVRNDPLGRPLPPDKIAALAFISEVQEYIKKCRLKLQLLARMKEIVVCIYLSRTTVACLNAQICLSDRMN